MGTGQGIIYLDPIFLMIRYSRQVMYREIYAPDYLILVVLSVLLSFCMAYGL